MVGCREINEDMFEVYFQNKYHRDSLEPLSAEPVAKFSTPAPKKKSYYDEAPKRQTLTAARDPQTASFRDPNAFVCQHCGHTNMSKLRSFCEKCFKDLVPRNEPRTQTAAATMPPLTRYQGIKPKKCIFCGRETYMEKCPNCGRSVL